MVTLSVKEARQCNRMVNFCKAMTDIPGERAFWLRQVEKWKASRSQCMREAREWAEQYNANSVPS